MKSRILILLIVGILLCSAVFFYHREQSRSAMERVGSAPVFVIDAGHGGEDGGAVSADGLRESSLNLAISLRTERLLAFFGLPCVLTREEETLSYPPEAKTVRQRKQADLDRRVRLTNEVHNGVLLSIHQNQYPTAGPRGAQALYRDEPESIRFAECLQAQLTAGLGEGVRSPTAISDSIYLMRMVHCPAVLVECGFLSNPEELRLLRSEGYQTRLALCLACGCLEYAKEWEKEYGQGSQG